MCIIQAKGTKQSWNWYNKLVGVHYKQLQCINTKIHSYLLSIKGHFLYIQTRQSCSNFNHVQNSYEIVQKYNWLQLAKLNMIEMTMNFQFYFTVVIKRWRCIILFIRPKYEKNTNTSWVISIVLVNLSVNAREHFFSWIFAGFPPVLRKLLNALYIYF